ncbi:MAG: copper resistance protein CopC [Pseudomonadota bacterium]|nr:copper resistance protein CopC [Pseudomonadota bacterium]
MLRTVVLATAAAGILMGGSVFAHAKLASSVPASNAQVAAAPTTLTLTFDEEVKLALLKLSSGGKGTPVTVDRKAKAAKTVVLPLPALSPGTYEVHWTAVAADDGHITKGTFAFTVGKT